ncbi:ribonuclease H-like domain-containing protein [uncultured Anaerococcus sp.]|uniref:ribonuclease H-like domain-containing protein n=1 Tax=uncultured Anaerococcus sp. TaxID=293428 RepID=UPI00262BCC60|nr:ribonuclease H-like domain-containing protein [uncultured Anaerococcus sp.]
MISKKIRIKGEKLNNKDLVLDIETTGLDFKTDKLVLLGLVKKENNKSYIFQYFAENDNEEIRLLKIFLREIKGKRLITFNGDTFDIPFLNSRLIAHQLMPVFIEESLDIYKIIKKNSKFFSYESMKLVNIEKLIGINRDDPSRYKVISKLTDDIITRDRPQPILKHNENDLIATEALSYIENLYINKLSIESKIGKFWLSRANINKDIGNFEYQSENILNDLFVAENNYQISIKKKTITLNLHVLYGKFNEVDNGFVSINTFDIKNESEIDINDGLLIIRENSTYNFKNLLNLCKKIIENHY